MTNPLPSELVAKLKSGTAWRFSTALGPVFKPRFFCCTDPNELGLVEGKEPVAIIEASPNPVIEGGTVAFDGTNSYDPDGSITGYDWSFPSGSPSSSTNSTENVTFATAGERTVRLTVTDGTGKRSVPAQVVIEVLAGADMMSGSGGQDQPGAAGGGVYVATESGLYFSSDAGQNWTALTNGLSGDALKTNDVGQVPATYGLAQEKHRLWIATDDGMYYSADGGQNWTQKNPGSVSNDDADSPAPTVADLLFTSLQFFGDRLYVIATWDNASGAARTWIFYTDDVGDSWSEV